MKTAFQRALVTTVLCATGMLSGCTGTPSVDDATTAINAVYKNGEANCWAPESLATLTFPLDVAMKEQSMNDLGILDGLNRSGLIAATMQPNPTDPDTVSESILHIDLTEKGKSAHVWDPKAGFCVGRHTVTHITSITPDPQREGAYDVRYRWTFDAPSWVGRDKFPRLNGMTQPGDGGAVIVKNANGWEWL